MIAKKDLTNCVLFRVNCVRAINLHANSQEVMPTIRMAGWGV